MKKIMFNDRYGFTQAVLDGRKTMTRRIVSEKLWDKWTEYDDFCGSVACGDIPTTRQYYHEKDFFLDHAPFKIGEIVAIAQSYKDKGLDPKAPLMEANGIGGYVRTDLCPGWTNKMFVRADLMPHQIRITDIRVERLQDISDEDCIKEGVREVCVSNNWGNSASHWEFQIPYDDKFGRTKLLRGTTPREAYAALIDRISGKGTWESNPYVFVYEFELVK